MRVQTRPLLFDGPIKITIIFFHVMPVVLFFFIRGLVIAVFFFFSTGVPTPFFSLLDRSLPSEEVFAFL